MKRCTFLMALLTWGGVFSLTFFGCSDDSENTPTEGIKIAIDCNGATTIGSFFDRLYITDGTVDENGYVQSGNGFLQIDSDTTLSVDSENEYVTFTNQNQQWTGGETLTLILYPKDYDQMTYEYAYKNDATPTVTIQQSANTADTLSNTAPLATYTSYGSDGTSKEVNLNIRRFFAATFTAKDSIIKIGDAIPKQIAKNDIRLANETGVSYIDTTKLKQNHIQSVQWQETNDANVTVYELPGLSYCATGTALSPWLHTEDGYQFSRTSTLSGSIGSESASITNSKVDLDSNSFEATFSAPSTDGDVLVLTIIGIKEIEDAFKNQSFTASNVKKVKVSESESTNVTGTVGTVSLAMGSDKTFTLTWGDQTFEGSYVMKKDYTSTENNTTYKYADLTYTTTANASGIETTTNYQWRLYSETSGDTTTYTLSNEDFSAKYPDEDATYTATLTLQQA